MRRHKGRFLLLLTISVFLSLYFFPHAYSEPAGPIDVSGKEPPIAEKPVDSDGKETEESSGHGSPKDKDKFPGGESPLSPPTPEKRKTDKSSDKENKNEKKANKNKDASGRNRKNSDAETKDDAVNPETPFLGFTETRETVSGGPGGNDSGVQNEKDASKDILTPTVNKNIQRKEVTALEQSKIQDSIDTDGDGIPNYLDPDIDGDGFINSLDGDIDGDGAANNMDLDMDGDGIPNNQDLDMDSDEIPNQRDTDIDGDRIPNNQDPDMDGDGIPNELDPDMDGDGIANIEDSDMDGDGVLNELDPDMDGDGVPNIQDPDRDADSLPNENDSTPNGFTSQHHIPLALPQ